MFSFLFALLIISSESHFKIVQSHHAIQNIFGKNGCVEGTSLTMPMLEQILQGQKSSVKVASETKTNNLNQEHFDLLYEKFYMQNKQNLVSDSNKYFINLQEGINSIKNTFSKWFQSTVQNVSYSTLGFNISNAFSNKRLDELIQKGKSLKSLVNEVAAINRIEYQYILVDESGLPHQKRFTIVLKLGDEQYSGDGKSVREAQRSAAKKALTSTKYKMPKINEDNPSSKSPISLVYEIGAKNKLKVTFSHTEDRTSKRFLTECCVDDLITHGDSHSKKISKNIAAEKMLEKLRTVSFKPSSKNRSKRRSKSGKKNHNVIKMYQDVNPITVLNQIQQKRTKSEPVYNYLGKYSNKHIVNVVIDGISKIGSGFSEKSAKRQAAENVLRLVGNSNTVETRVKGSNLINSGKNNQRSSHIGKQVLETFQNLIPDVRLNDTANNLGVDIKSYATKILNADGAQLTGNTLSRLAGVSVDSQQFVRLSKSTNDIFRPTQKLLDLSKFYGFQMHFSNFSLDGSKDIFSFVSLYTVPPQVCYGVGEDIQDSRDQASLFALGALSKLNVLNKVPTEKNKERPIDAVYNKNNDIKTTTYINK